jgi:putative Mn2+ efflux pump MntP
LFVIPLGLDTFAVSAALGVAGVAPASRLRISLVLASFEAAMPLIGLFVGHATGHAIGTIADYLAIVILAAVGGWILFGEDEREKERVAQVEGSRGLALAALGLSVSLDELAVGFTIGLLHLPILTAVVLIGAQAFLLSQLGLRVGARLNETVREGTERIAGLALIGLALLLLVEQST